MLLIFGPFLSPNVRARLRQKFDKVWSVFSIPMHSPRNCENITTLWTWRLLICFGVTDRKAPTNKPRVSPVFSNLNLPQRILNPDLHSNRTMVIDTSCCVEKPNRCIHTKAAQGKGNGYFSWMTVVGYSMWMALLMARGGIPSTLDTTTRKTLAFLSKDNRLLWHARQNHLFQYLEIVS